MSGLKALRRVVAVQQADRVNALDVARWQFAVTTVYHFIFVPLTIGISLLVAGMQTAWYRTDNPVYLRMTKFLGSSSSPLAMEGVLAFFLGSTFLGLWIFGWDKLPRKIHLATIWLASIGTMISAYFILAAVDERTRRRDRCADDEGAGFMHAGEHWVVVGAQAMGRV